MTPQEINRKIAEWLGWEHIKTEVHPAITYEWCSSPTSYMTLLPDYYNTNEAFDLLDDLSVKEYAEWTVGKWPNNRYYCAIPINSDENFCVADTRSAAICRAVIRLIEKEKSSSETLNKEKENV